MKNEKKPDTFLLIPQSADQAMRFNNNNMKSIPALIYEKRKLDLNQMNRWIKIIFLEDNNLYSKESKLITIR